MSSKDSKVNGLPPIIEKEYIKKYEAVHVNL